MINKVILLGNVGVDPEVREVARIRVATTERYTDQQGKKQEQTEWHSVTLWGGLADVVDKYVHKGSQVFLEGKIRTREYDHKGEKRYATEIIANDLKLLGRPKDANDAPAQEVVPTPQTPAPPMDDLPF